jgi:hypothetical protein
MKTTRILIFLSFISMVLIFDIKANSNEASKLKSIPNAVINKLNSLYPGANNIKWKRTLFKYQADFVFENKSISFLFNPKGKIINSKIEIDSTSLPSKVLEVLKKEYLNDNYKIIYCMKRTDKEGELYEIEVMKGRGIFIIRYSVSGKLLNKYILQKVDILNPPFLN